MFRGDSYSRRKIRNVILIIIAVVAHLRRMKGKIGSPVVKEIISWLEVIAAAVLILALRKRRKKQEKR